MYSTLEQFKQYLWLDVSDTSQDAMLTSFLNTANAKLNNLCWVDSFARWTYTQTVEARWIYESPRWFEFYLKNKPVVSIDKMNWESDVWDYLVIYDRRIITKKISLNDWNMLDIEYTAWYETIPDDLKLLEMMIASWLRQEHNYEWVSEYRLWDETIKFWSKTWNNWVLSPDDIYFSFTTLLNKYKNFYLPV